MFPGKSVRILAAVLAGAFACGRPALAAEVWVAAASDLNFALREIASEFERQTGHQVKLSTGSSGNFYAQILNGAPFDLFLSADREYARQLDQAGRAEAGTLRPYATGRIVLWVRRGSPIDVAALGMRAALHSSVRKIAIANPKHAPYGRASVAALRHFNLYERVKTRLVLGENAAQAAQFVQSGGAEIGILALSLALSPPMRQAGRYWEIPQDSYPRLEQGMVILKTARSRAHSEAVRALYDWIQGDAGRRILNRHGFILPLGESK